ncbi:glycosyltransferase family 2 protein [Paenibacillus aceris]|nr:glycosyltransferase family 2 protein [Paenibacillus aceris]
MVSVIMSVFNTNDETLLQHSIQSIISQTFSNFEFIICDDGSTDGTYEILETISKGDSRIKLIKNETNLRAATARNRCISLSKGKYIAVMDADDYSAVNRLQIQVDFLENNKEIDFVGSGADLYNENGIWGHRKYNSTPENKDFLFVLPFIHASVMFRKKALKAVGGYRVAKETIRTEDYDLFMRLYANGYKGVNLEDTLYFINEDQSLYKRRKYYHKFNEAVVRYKGFRALGLMPGGFLYVIKPLIVGLIPLSILNLLKDKYYRHKKLVDK